MKTLRRPPLFDLLIIFAVLCFFATCAGGAHAETIGQALFRNGYTATLFVMQPNQTSVPMYQCGTFVDGNGQSFPKYCARFAFNAAGVSHLERYGVTESGQVIKGNDVGERIMPLDRCQLTFLGLPGDTIQDLTSGSDLKAVTKPQGRPAYDALKPFRCATTPPVDPCGVCPTCETCPSCPPPPPPPPCPVCQALPPLSAANQRADEIGALLRPIYYVFATHPWYRKKLPSWTVLWSATKPLVVEAVLSVRRHELRAAGVE